MKSSACVAIVAAGLTRLTWSSGASAVIEGERLSSGGSLARLLMRDPQTARPTHARGQGGVAPLSWNKLRGANAKGVRNTEAVRSAAMVLARANSREERMTKANRKRSFDIEALL